MSLNKYNSIILFFFFGCIGSSLLRAGSEHGLLFIAVRGLAIVVASVVAEHGL